MQVVTVSLMFSLFLNGALCFQRQISIPHIYNSKKVSIRSTSSLTISNFDTRLNPLHRKLSIPAKYGPHLQIKSLVLNFWTIIHALVLLTIASLVIPSMLLIAGFSSLTGLGKNRRALDWIIHYWAKISMRLSGSGPVRLYGAENLPPHDEAVIYVPNHTTFFDILVMSGFVPRAFKYLSKAEILHIPLVGLGMRLAKHVFLKRNDIKSTIECSEKVDERLREGSSMVLFAEGTRSVNGKLKEFKKGAFQMAKKAGVRVVPVSIGHLHRWLPASSPLPVAPIRHTYIKIHPPIDTKDMKIKDIKAQCFEAVNSGLPSYQKYVPPAAPQAPASEGTDQNLENSIVQIEELTNV